MLFSKKFTKIVATISDKRCDVDFIKALYEEGMNVIRMNSAHLDNEGFLKIINNARKVSKNIALLVDTKGPEVRTTINENDEPIKLVRGEKIRVVGSPDQPTNHDIISVSYPFFVRDLHVSDKILIDDGELELLVLEKYDDYLECVVDNDGKLGSRKSVNVPGVRINLPSLTEKDKKNIVFAIEQGLDFIAHSFVRSKQDLLDIQKILDEHNSDIKIISKIENQEGVDNIDEILEVTYGIMVARGDLGIEVAQEKIPGIQRTLIRKCVKARRPVIVATQMLHSMIENPRPTRAEVTDIANAIHYRTDALMLSGETAYGKYPVEAVRTMAKIAAEAEKTKLAETEIPVTIYEKDIASFLANSTYRSTQDLNISAIVTDTYSGRTPRYVAAYRCTTPILAICYVEKTTRVLALSYGVFPYHQEDLGSPREYFITALSTLYTKGWIEKDDYITYTSGPTNGLFGTNFLEINKVALFLDEKKAITKTK